MTDVASGIEPAFVTAGNVSAAFPVPGEVGELAP